MSLGSLLASLGVARDTLLALQRVVGVPCKRGEDHEQGAEGTKWKGSSTHSASLRSLRVIRLADLLLS
jgi:hypothetical protein